MDAHPLAEMIPAMTDAEYDELKAGIEANGQLQPIATYEGQILDGRHRYRACTELEIEPRTFEYDGDEPVAYVISLNVHRRQLTTAQRAEIGRLALPALQREAKRRQGEHARTAERDERGHVQPSPDRSTPTRAVRAADLAGEAVGVSSAAVNRITKIANERPDLHEQVISGDKTLNAAYEETTGRATGGRAARVVPMPEHKTSFPPAAQMNKRQRELTTGAKGRVEKAVGTCNGIARGFEALRIDWATAVATPEEIQGWDKSFRDAIAAIRRARQEIKSNQEVANAA